MYKKLSAATLWKYRINQYSKWLIINVYLTLFYQIAHPLDGWTFLGNGSAQLALLWRCLSNQIYLTLLLGNCPSYGGVNVAGQCLYFNENKKTWDEAVSACAMKNQRLASPRDPAAVNTYLQHHHGMDDSLNICFHWFY